MKRKRNPGKKGLKGATAKQERQYEAIKKSELVRGEKPKTAKRIAAATVRKQAKAKKKNKTVIKAKRVVVLNKTANKSTRKTKKTKSKKRVAVSSHRTKKAAKSRARSTSTNRKAPIIGSRKRAVPKRKAAVKKTTRKLRRRNPAPSILAVVNKTSPKAQANRKEFAGEYRKDTPLYFPEGTPGGLSKIGKLLQIKTKQVIVKPHTQTWLCRDTQGRLHLGTISKDGVIWNGPAQDFGKVIQVDYEDVKKHLGYKKPQGFYHFMGEEDGNRPTLYADGKGGLKFKGGNYRFTSRGIEN
jgi:hypothetical protein